MRNKPKKRAYTSDLRSDQIKVIATYHPSTGKPETLPICVIRHPPLSRVEKRQGPHQPPQKFLKKLAIQKSKITLDLLNGYWKLRNIPMATLKTKDFVKAVLIDELGTMIDPHPYLSFDVMATGIEFLGKCIKADLDEWNPKTIPSKTSFNDAINSIPSLQKYAPLLNSHDLYDSLRCGLAHTIAPKIKITLSSKGEMGHMVEVNGRINLKAEDFYSDFKSACEYVINIDYPINNKMNQDFLTIPDQQTASGTDAASGMSTHIIYSGSTPPQIIK